MQHVHNIFDQNLLEKLVSLSSWAPEEKNITSFLETYLKKIGCHVERVPIAKGRTNLLVTRGKSPHTVLFYGHVDTVKIIHPELWKTDPLTLTLQNGLAYGLGSYDMKGGLAACLSAFCHTTTPVKLLLCVDEEEISEGAWTVVKERSDFFSDVQLIISAEPNFDLGLHGITTARTGRCLFTTIFKGSSAHIARFQEGKDALALSLGPLTKLYGVQHEWYKTYGTVIQVRQITGESTGMSVMDTIACTIEAIVGTNDSIEAIQKRLETLLHQEIHLKERKTPYLTSYSFETFPYQQEISDIIFFHTKKNMKLHHRVSVGDDNVFATLGIPVITWGPDGGNAHAANEYVSLSSLDILTRMYKELLDRLQ